MSSQYDHLMGSEQRTEDHPNNSHNYKMAGDVIQLPISMATSDANRLTAPRYPDERPIPAMTQYGSSIATYPK